MISTNNPNIPNIPPRYVDPDDPATSSKKPYTTQHYYNERLARTLEKTVADYINTGRKVCKWEIKAFGTEKKLRLMLNSARAFVTDFPSLFDPEVVKAISHARFGKNGEYLYLHEPREGVYPARTYKSTAAKLDLSLGAYTSNDEAGPVSAPDEPSHTIPVVSPSDTRAMTDAIKTTILSWHKSAGAKEIMDHPLGLSQPQVDELQAFITANNIAGKVRTTGLKLIKL